MCSLLDFLHECPDISDLVVVAPTQEAVQPWVDIWGATRHVGDQVVQIEPSRLSSPVVRAAIDTLIHGQPAVTLKRERAAAVDLFVMLRRAGEHVDAAALRAHVLRETAWRTKQVDLLVEIAQRVRSS
jgi:hypothetical protein